MNPIPRLLPLLSCLFAVPALSLGAARPGADLAACQGKKLLYVMMLNAEPGADVKSVQVSIDSDLLAIKHLESLGFQVTKTDEFSPVELAKDKDLIVVSETVSANLVGSKYKFAAVPALVMENDLFDDMGMTGMKIDSDFGTDKAPSTFIDLINPSHPLSAGLPPGPAKMYSEIPAKNNWNWGRPGLGAIVIATLPGEREKAAIFGYEKGATMDYDMIAPARRVGFFQSQRTFNLYTPEALKLYDAAMAWAVSPPRDDSRAPTASASGKQLLFVRGTGRLERMKAKADADPKALKVLQALEEDEAKTAEHLKSLGFSVTVADDSAAAGMVGGKDVVFIAQSADADQIRGAFRGLAVPIVNSNTELFPDLRMTGKRETIDYGSNYVYAGSRFFWLANAPHALSGGIKPGIQNVYSDADLITWGFPYPSASIVATIEGEPRRASVFGYETGATMGDDFAAPARRVGLFLNGTYHMLLPEGVALLDSAVLWAANAQK